jgi:hypothetical protein
MDKLDKDYLCSLSNETLSVVAKCKCSTVVATGITSAYFGDERSIVEFVVADTKLRSLQDLGENAFLLLINDTFDPLTERHIRVAKRDGFDANRLKEYIGIPIYEVPDFDGCHLNYAQHCVNLVQGRLEELDIHPKIITSDIAYRTGVYTNCIQTVIKNYDAIKEEITANFGGYTIKNLLRPQCPECKRLTTEVKSISDDRITFHCIFCNVAIEANMKDVNMKLSWKLDCAARWNLYDIDYEAFCQNYCSGPCGTVPVAEYISRRYFGGKVPMIVSYGRVRLEDGLNRNLLRILPTAFIKKLLSTGGRGYVKINKNKIIEASKNFMLNKETSYYQLASQIVVNSLKKPDGLSSLTINTAIEFAKDILEIPTCIQPPETSKVTISDRSIMQIAKTIVALALAERKKETDINEFKKKIKEQFYDTNDSKQMLHYFRELFGVEAGPSVPTLLFYVPISYLETLQRYLQLEIAQTGLQKGG